VDAEEAERFDALERQHEINHAKRICHCSEQELMHKRNFAGVSQTPRTNIMPLLQSWILMYAPPASTDRARGAYWLAHIMILHNAGEQELVLPFYYRPLGCFSRDRTLGFQTEYNSKLEERLSKTEWEQIMHELNHGFVHQLAFLHRTIWIPVPQCFPSLIVTPLPCLTPNP
jgi:hypothetical protein